jgi:hypothetical protein
LAKYSFTLLKDGPGYKIKMMLSLKKHCPQRARRLSKAGSPPGGDVYKRPKVAAKLATAGDGN